MPGETNLTQMLRTMQPKLNDGAYVFCACNNPAMIPADKIIMRFKETEGYTLILDRETADAYGFSYSFTAAWITLTVHSALEGVGLTAAFSGALARNGISCNVVAALYHDHIFIAHTDAAKAMDTLRQLSAQYQ